MAIWYVLRPFGIFYGHLVYLLVIWYIFPLFGCMLHQEKSGNPSSRSILTSSFRDDQNSSHFHWAMTSFVCFLNISITQANFFLLFKRKFYLTKNEFLR
jgi:hypothetical protein